MRGDGLGVTVDPANQVTEQYAVRALAAPEARSEYPGDGTEEHAGRQVGDASLRRSLPARLKTQKAIDHHVADEVYATRRNPLAT